MWNNCISKIPLTHYSMHDIVSLRVELWSQTICVQISDTLVTWANCSTFKASLKWG